MKLRMALMIAAAISLASADTLTLRDGRTVEGSYLGGSARQVRMAVGDAIQSFDVSDIQSIRFENPSVSAAPATAAGCPCRGRARKARHQAGDRRAGSSRDARRGRGSRRGRRLRRPVLRYPPARTSRSA